MPGLPGDLPLRGPMSWGPDAATGSFTTGTPFRALAPNLATNNVQSQLADPASLLHFYKAMLTLRNTLPSIALGRQEHGFAQGLVAGWQRVHAGERTQVLINYGRELAQAEMANLPPGARLLSAFPEGRALSTRADAGGEAKLWLGPQSVRVLVVDSGATRAGKARKGGKTKAKPKAAKPRRAPAKKSAANTRPAV